MATPRLRVAIGGLEHETNTFATAYTGLTRRKDFFELQGEAIVKHHAHAGTPVGGFLAAAADIGIDTVPCYYAIAEPSGVIEQASLDAMKASMLESIKAVLPVDAVALDLHGAGVSEGCEDIESDIGAAVRDLVGPGVKIVCSLDLHGNIHPAMTTFFDAFVSYRLYPHEDQRETGYKVFGYLPGLCSGELTLAIHIEPLPMMLPTNTTDTGYPHADVNRLCTALEEMDSALVDLRVNHGFPWADIARPMPTVVATVARRAGDAGDEAGAAAAAAARQVATYLWGIRDKMIPNYPGPEVAVANVLRLAAATQTLEPKPSAALRGPVVVNEASDNTGCGAVGDATHLLSAMLAAGLGEKYPGKVAFAVILDPTFVAAATAAGVGSRVDHRLGGWSGPEHGKPIEIKGGEVKALSNGKCVLERYAPGLEMSYGQSVRVLYRGIEIVVVSRRGQTFDTTPLQMMGLDASTMVAVGLKSSIHFRAGFRELSNGFRPPIVTSDSPGLSTNALERFQRKNLTAPLWPLDTSVEYSPGGGPGGVSNL